VLITFRARSMRHASCVHVARRIPEGVETSILDTLVDIVACCDPDGTIRYANPSACRISGKTADDMVGHSLWELYPGTRVSQLHDAFERVSSTGQSEHFEFHYDAWRRWFENHLYAHRGSIWMITRDVTEQKLATARLEILAAASRAFSEAAIDGATMFQTIARHVATVVHDLCLIRLLSETGDVLEDPVGSWDEDPAVRALLGGLGSEPVGGDISAMQPVVIERSDPAIVAARLAPPEHQQREMERLGIHSIIVMPLRARDHVLGVLAVCRREAATRESYDGSDVWLVQELADRIALVISQRQALVARQRSERALELERTKLRALIQDAPVAIVVYAGPEHVAVLSNPLHDEMSAQRVALGKPLVESIPELAGTEIEQALDEVYATGNVRKLPALHAPLMRDGDMVDHWFECTLQALPGLDGSTEAVLGTAIEITAHVQAVAVRDEFLSIASHELRTPLTALDLQLESALGVIEREHGIALDRLRAKLNLALKQTDRLTTLVESLLSVGRIDGGRFVLEREEIDLVQLVEEIRERFEQPAARAGSELVIDVPERCLGFWDRARIDQVITNLISNAIKYGEGRPIRISVSAEDQLAMLSVHDQGIGIAPHDLARIFDRFERAVPSKNYGGLGLGLYIAKQIVTAHGGTLDVESIPDHGSTFRARLPRYPEINVSR
jgi:PAS domain S-box-containing protein